MLAIIVCVVLLLGGLGTLGFGLYATHEAQQPTVAANAFCADMQAKQYGAAYNLLASGYQSQIAKEQFVEDATLHDQVDGPVSQCLVLHSNAPWGFTLRLISNAQVDVQFRRHQTYAGRLGFTKSDSGWKVETISRTLQGTDLGGLKVGMTFCKALVNKDYAAAYNTFSSRERSGGTEQEFAASFTKAFGADLQVTGCTPDVASYTVAKDTQSATVDADLQLTFRLPSSGPVKLPATLTLVTENGAWKVDGIAVKSA